jgi:hypothetical protein
MNLKRKRANLLKQFTLFRTKIEFFFNLRFSHLCGMQEGEYQREG